MFHHALIPWRPIQETEEWYPTFISSRWFTRGFTLQELLAPRHVEFMSSSWDCLGTREQEAFSISGTTGISEEYLADFPTGKPFHRSDMRQTVAVAQRMSWASERQTTREEDMAYSLLGIFGVSMSLIYGEGSNAFLRLQEEIARTSADFTLLAWNLPSMEGDGVLGPEQDPYNTAFDAVLRTFSGAEMHPWCASPAQPKNTVVHPSGCLAPHPSYFRGCGNLCTLRTSVQGSTDWSAGSNTLTINAPLSENKRPYLLLPCYPGNGPVLFLSIPLSSISGGLYARSWLPTRYVASRTWYRWPKKRVVFSMRGDRVSQLLSSERNRTEIVWIKPLPPSIKLRGIELPKKGVYYTHGFTTTYNLLQVEESNMRDPALPIMAIRLHETDSDELAGENFTLVLRPPPIQENSMVRAWKTRSGILGSWPWNIEVLDIEFPRPVLHSPQRVPSFELSSMSGRDELDETAMNLCLSRHHLSVTVSLDYLGDRRVFAVDVHQSHPLIGYHTWNFLHCWLPTALHTLLDALLVLMANAGGIIPKNVLEAATLPYLRVLRYYYLEIVSLLATAQLVGHFAGYVLREGVTNLFDSRRTWLYLDEHLSKLAIPWGLPYELYVPVLFYNILPLVSLFLPSSSRYLRLMQLPIAGLLGILFLHIRLGDF